ncbi:MAG TPA: hypothetical protein VKP13_12170 [Nitrospira sp.]|nr:hypothetical protein [Nitrospira sp.]
MTQGLAFWLHNRAEVSTDKRHLSQQGEAVTVSHSEDDSAPLIQVAVRRPADAGIMVLSSACKVLYANKAAYRYFKRLNRGENGYSTDGAFPVSVANFLDGMLKSLETRTADRDREQLQVRRLLVERDQALLLQAFGIPDRLNVQRSRIVLTISEASRP